MKNVFRDIYFRNTENTLCSYMTEVLLSCMTAGHREAVSVVTQTEKIHRCKVFGGIFRG